MSNIIRLPDCKCKTCMQNWLNSVLDAGLAPTEDDLLLLESAKPKKDDQSEDDDDPEAANDRRVPDDLEVADETASATEDSLPPIDSEWVSYNDLGDQLFIALDSRKENEGTALFKFLLDHPLSVDGNNVYCGRELIALISEYERRILNDEGV